jgi:hypothetical protein
VIIYGLVDGKRDQSAQQPASLRADDLKFQLEVKALPDPLARIGIEMVKRVRQSFNGSFERAENGRFINRPDNFWTIKIQPRDQSYIITVRGYPHEFKDVRSLEIKDDRSGYSRFKLRTPSQFEDAWRVIERAGNR